MSETQPVGRSPRHNWTGVGGKQGGAKVNQCHFEGAFLLGNKDVFWLDIRVYDRLPMHVLQGREKLPRDGLHLRRWHGLLLLLSAKQDADPSGPQIGGGLV